ncbi:MAG: hypothetical protein KatS3mg008_1481 [Acidimicrobiales bacterium]|nr:MAG: hypothetical protein KatS3mg008_1481 [Acidimicrobiales bacterium]
MPRKLRPGEEPTPWGLYVAMAAVAVVAIGVVLFFALRSGDEEGVRIAAPVPDETTTTTETVEATTTTAVAVSSECSARSFRPREFEPQPELPRRVRAKRLAILRAAFRCDYDALADQMDKDFTFEFGSPETGPEVAISAWKQAEAEGTPVIYSLIRILQMDYETATDGTFVWPAQSQWRGPRWQNARADDLRELVSVYGQAAVERWQEAGNFDGHRVGIRPDGKWFYFTGAALAQVPQR